MKKLFFLFSLYAAVTALSVCPALAAEVNMRARQPFYGTEFDVYRTPDMPANWFKTYDGYYVTRRLDANWVYGRVTPNGVEFTDILVGSIDPGAAPELGNAASQTPVYVPPAPASEAAASLESPFGTADKRARKTGMDKVNDPEYQKELQEILKGLKVRGPIFLNLSTGALVSDLSAHVHSTFGEQMERPGEKSEERFDDLMGRFIDRRLSSRGANLYDYSYPYLTRRHFSTKVPLDFHILHERASGQVEFYVTMGARDGFRSYNVSQKDIRDSSRILQYLEKIIYQYASKDFSDKDIRFSPDIVFYFEYAGDEAREMDESDFYLLTPLPFEDEGLEPGVHGWQPPYSTYGLRLATTARSSLLPMPTYESLMQKIAKAKRVRIFSSTGDSTHYNRKKTWKLLGIIELSAIDQKNRFTKSMEARYETYKKIVELEERWQGETEEPERTPHPGTWPLDKALDADWIYNTLMTTNVLPLMDELTGLFGDPEITERNDTRSNRVVAHMSWVRGRIRAEFDYLFQGGRWYGNQWVMEGRPIVFETREDGRQAFATRVDEFSRMLGNPKLKQTSRAVWFVGDYDEAKFTIEQSGNSLTYWIGKRRPLSDWKGTVIDPVE